MDRKCTKDSNKNTLNSNYDSRYEAKINSGHLRKITFTITFTTLNLQIRLDKKPQYSDTFESIVICHVRVGVNTVYIVSTVTFLDFSLP